MSITPFFAFVRVAGPDAAVFLNGQFSHNTLNLSPGDVRLGAFCNPKGRALATAILISNDDGFELWSVAATLPTLIASLRRYVMRSKVTFTDQPEVRDARFALVGGATLTLSAADFEMQAIRAGVPLLHAANAEAFVPQMINLDLLDGIDFSKGCYTGQEIVARTQNLGKIKRRMLAFACEQPRGLVPGDKIVTDRDESVGRVIGVGEDRVLASARLATLKQKLIAGEPGRLLGDIILLPYEIPELKH